MPEHSLSPDDLVALIAALALSGGSDATLREDALEYLSGSEWGRRILEDPFVEELVSLERSRYQRLQDHELWQVVSMVRRLQRRYDQRIGRLEEQVAELERLLRGSAPRPDAFVGHGRVWIGDPVPGELALEAVTRSFESLAEALGLEPVLGMPPQRGSWVKDLWYRMRGHRHAQGVRSTAIVVKDGQVAKHGWLPQAEVERIRAETEKLRAEARKLDAESELAEAQASKVRREIESSLEQRLIELLGELRKCDGNASFVLDRFVGQKSLAGNGSPYTAVVYASDEMLRAIGEGDLEVISSPGRLRALLLKHGVFDDDGGRWSGGESNTRTVRFLGQRTVREHDADAE